MMCASLYPFVEVSASIYYCRIVSIVTDLVRHLEKSYIPIFDQPRIIAVKFIHIYKLLPDPLRALCKCAIVICNGVASPVPFHVNEIELFYESHFFVLACAYFRRNNIMVNWKAILFELIANLAALCFKFVTGYRCSNVFLEMGHDTSIPPTL